ncbi:hypothetical protein BDR05DRAFT_464714 [Suillus weaverae]|nr:hypothetical protein BDR05DRAFT_464714 [Suillus weaverae]
MPVVSNDPSWWPLINLNIFFSHWTVAAGVVVVYDWVLTLGQEIELIWVSKRLEKQEKAMNSRQRQRWSLMTVLYLVIRYIGLPYSVYVLRPTKWLCANSSSLTISVYILSMSHMH